MVYDFAVITVLMQKFPFYRSSIMHSVLTQKLVCAHSTMGHKRSEVKPVNCVILCILLCSIIQCGKAWKQETIPTLRSGFNLLAPVLLLQQAPFEDAAPIRFKAELVISEINAHGFDNNQVKISNV